MDQETKIATSYNYYDKLLWLVIIILSIPLFIYLVSYLSLIQSLFVEPFLFITLTFMKLFNIPIENFTPIVISLGFIFPIYVVLIFITSLLFILIAQRHEAKSPWKYSALLIALLVVLFIIYSASVQVKEYKIKQLREKETKSQNINHLLPKITIIDYKLIPDIKKEKNILKVDFHLLNLPTESNKYIIKSQIRDDKKSILSISAINVELKDNRWILKNYPLNESLSSKSGVISVKNTLHDDRREEPKAIHLTMTIISTDLLSDNYNKIIYEKEFTLWGKKQL